VVLHKPAHGGAVLDAGEQVHGAVVADVKMRVADARGARGRTHAAG
jgi:hypothetical protein